MNIEHIPENGDNAAELLTSDWMSRQGFGESASAFSPRDLIYGASYWFAFARPDWKVPRCESGGIEQPIARLIRFLDSFLDGGSEVDLAGIVVKKSTPDLYEIQLAAGINVDAIAACIKSSSENQSVFLTAGKKGGVVVRVVSDVTEDDDYVGMKACAWEITGSGITELTESGRKGRHYPSHGNWSFHGSDKFESYHRVKDCSPVILRDGSEVVFAKGKVRVVCDGKQIEFDYANNLLVIHDTGGSRWEHPRPTVTGRNGEILQLHGVEQVYGRVAINWTVNDLKIETKTGGLIEVENILGQSGSIYYEKNKS